MLVFVTIERIVKWRCARAHDLQDYPNQVELTPEVHLLFALTGIQMIPRREKHHRQRAKRVQVQRPFNS